MRCSVCNREMTLADGSITSIVGISIEIRGTEDTFAKQLAEIYPELPNGYRIDVCYVCWIKSLGVQIDKKETSDV